VICHSYRGASSRPPHAQVSYALINSDNGSRRTAFAIQLDPAGRRKTIVCDRLCRGNTWGTLLCELLAHVLITVGGIGLPMPGPVEKNWSDCMKRSLGLFTAGGL